MHNRRHGRGLHTEADGSRYDGHWRDGERNGAGTCHYADGSCARGEWLGETALSAVVVCHRDGNAVCRLGSPCTACSVVTAPLVAPDAARLLPSGDPQDATME
nr:Morn repeat domain containing protein [Pandoravirus belohorizontensis]